MRGFSPRRKDQRAPWVNLTQAANGGLRRWGRAGGGDMKVFTLNPFHCGGFFVYFCNLAFGPRRN